jgi:hypothetical protein
MPDENRDHYEHHPIEDIDPTKIKTRSSITNGICESFHKTILNEFCWKRCSRTQPSGTPLQHRATSSGKYCYGKTPTETFAESKHLAKEKELDNETWWSHDPQNRTPTTIANLSAGR